MGEKNIFLFIYRPHLHQHKVYFLDKTVEGKGETPPEIIKQVAQIVREIERVCNGIPQHLEWTYDGEQLWLLQTRQPNPVNPLILKILILIRGE